MANYHVINTEILLFSDQYPLTKKIVDMQANVGAKADIVRIEVRLCI